MRNYLHGRAEIVTAAFFANHVFVNAPGSVIVVAACRRANKTFVMSQIQIRFGAIIRHIHLAVLERAHRSWINVDIRVELEEGNFQAARFEQRTEGGGGDPLP